jgi:ferredoxin
MSYEIRIEGTDVKFDAEVGQTVLDAAARHGIEMPYSCRKGACGNCKGRVLSGELVVGTGGGGHEAGINAPDEHLFCRAQPASDLLIQPRAWHRIDPDARKTYAASGRRGFVHQAVLESFDSVKDFDVYTCGAPIMVQAVRTALEDQRELPPTQFFSDSFVTESSIAVV